MLLCITSLISYSQSTWANNVTLVGFYNLISLKFSIVTVRYSATCYHIGAEIQALTAPTTVGGTKLQKFWRGAQEQVCELNKGYNGDVKVRRRRKG